MFSRRQRLISAIEESNLDPRCRERVSKFTRGGVQNRTQAQRCANRHAQLVDQRLAHRSGFRLLIKARLANRYSRLISRGLGDFNVGVAPVTQLLCG